MACISPPPARFYDPYCFSWVFIFTVLKYGHPYPQHCCQFFTDSGNSHLVSLIIFQRIRVIEGERTDIHIRSIRASASSSLDALSAFWHPASPVMVPFKTRHALNALTAFFFFIFLPANKKVPRKNIYRNFHCKYKVFNLTFIVTVQYLQNGNRLAWSDICLTLAPLALRLRFSSDLPTNNLLLYYTLPPLLCL